MNKEKYNKIWATFFRKLARKGEDVMLYMTMQNGAEFHRLLPPLEGILEDTFAEKYEWPFKFSDISRVDFFEHFEHGSFVVRNDPKMIQEAVSNTEGLQETPITRVSVMRSSG